MTTITNRDMQNPDEPNLPFAQSFPIHNEAPIPINFGQSLALSSLSRRQTYYDYTVKGDIAFPFGLGKIDGVKRLTESNASNYRRMGYSVVKIVETGGILTPKPPSTTSSGNGGLSRSQVEKIIESYHGDDISLLHKHAVDFGKSLSASKDERDRIETKLDKAKAEHQNIWDSLGQKSDVSHFHIGGGNGNGNGKDCGWDIGCHIDNFKEQIGGIAIIGGVVLVGYFLLKRRIRK